MTTFYYSRQVLMAGLNRDFFGFLLQLSAEIDPKFVVCSCLPWVPTSQ